MSEALILRQAAAPPPRLIEDTIAIWLGLGVFLFARLSLLGADALGWLSNFRAGLALLAVLLVINHLVPLG